MRLFPYVWTYAKGLASDGRAIERPLGLAYPELGAHPWDTYLLGEHLLVAPVVEAGARSRAVLLPPGSWVDWWTGELHEGSRTIERAAPLELLPLYARAGALIPLLRPTIDTTAQATAPGVESFASDPGVLHVALTPGPLGTFTLYDGTLLGQDTYPVEGGQDLTVDVAPGSTFTQGVVFEIYGLGLNDEEASVWSGPNETPRSDTLEDIDSDAIGWAWSHDRGGTAWLHVPAGVHSLRVALRTASR